ncbi:MAG: ATP-binding protein, partial [Prevotella sp.]|nr:ATP-binding protein [Prevotella sp.]
LQIAGVASQESSLIVSGDNDTEGMQIDLLIDRADDVVNVCEMKFSKLNYVITKSYADKLMRHIDQLERTQPNKKYHLTFVTVNPIERNAYSDIVKSSITSDELFR